MTTFVLMHGSWHRGSHLRLLVSELEKLGHVAVAPDLPSDRPEAGAADYAKAAMDAVGDTDEPLVVLGHSMTGLAVPVVAQMRPVHRMVFLAAMFPVVGKNATDGVPPGAGTDWFRTQVEKAIEHDDESVEWPAELAAETFFYELPHEQAMREARRRRPRALPQPARRAREAPGRAGLTEDEHRPRLVLAPACS